MKKGCAIIIWFWDTMDGRSQINLSVMMFVHTGI